MAAREYPDEALQDTDENIDDIQTHYEFLLEHELIKNKIARPTFSGKSASGTIGMIAHVG